MYVVELRKADVPPAKIATILQMKHETVRTILRTYKTSGGRVERAQAGRKGPSNAPLTAQQQHMLIALAQALPTASLASLAAKVSDITTVAAANDAAAAAAIPAGGSASTALAVVAPSSSATGPTEAPQKQQQQPLISAKQVSSVLRKAGMDTNPQRKRVQQRALINAHYHALAALHEEEAAKEKAERMQQQQQQQQQAPSFDEHSPPPPAQQPWSTLRSPPLRLHSVQHGGVDELAAASADELPPDHAGEQAPSMPPLPPEAHQLLLQRFPSSLFAAPQR
jgi:hypothetical protein